MLPRIAVFVITASAAFAACAQTLYKSVSPDGKITYTDRPPPQGSSAKAMKIEDLPNTALPPGTLEELRLLRASSVAGAMFKTKGVVLFAAPWCGYCRQAKAYLVRKSVPYQEHDIDTPAGKLAYIQAGGTGGIPLLIANGQKVRGYSQQAYDSVLAVRR